MSITRIWERLYLGSLKDASQLAAANPFGITAVVSLCSHKVPHRARNVSYTRVPIADSRPISARQFEAVMAAIAQGIRQGNLLIHCVGGVSRSLIIVGSLLTIAQLRPITDPSPVLLRSVGEHLSR